MDELEYLFQYRDMSVQPLPAKRVMPGTVELEVCVIMSVMVTLCVTPEEEAEALERSRLAATLEENIQDRGVSAFDFDSVDLVARYVPAKGK